jgi:5-(carboxyamino)imidazole ribonucleotide synthase
MQKIGILGGGQLGRMLLQAAANYPVETFILENDDQCPAAHLCHHFVKGDTIEIESVNEDALDKLEQEGVRVYPRPSALRTIKNKILQKEFYKQLSIPTPAFVVTQNLAELRANADFLPAVHKVGVGGYDGRGVQLINTNADINKGFDAPAVLEKMVTIQREISVIIAVNDKFEHAFYPPVEMIVNPRLNLLDYQLAPAELTEKTLWKVEALALAVVKGLKSPGIFAVELFIDKQGDVFVNETAPRVHNSGHHTIEANYSSQFDMLWRVMLQYPLGNTDHIIPAAIVNLVGADGFEGEAKYEGLEEVLKMENVFIHLYGKKQTKPGRKMGHVTIVSKERQELTFKANRIKNILKVVS